MKVVVAVAGCPAALRVPGYVARIRQDVHDVSICTVVSDSAKLFLPSAVMTNLSDVYLDAAEKFSVPWHIQLAEEYDLLVTMPASASRIGRYAGGLGMDLLDCLSLAFGDRHYIFPSMNSMLWQSPLVQRNVRTLEQVGVRIWKQTSNCIELANGRVETAISLPPYKVWLQEVRKQ